MPRRAAPSDAPAWLPLALAMREAQLQELVRRAAILHGWKFYHCWNSRHSPAGFPDIIAIRAGVLLVAELKREWQLPSEDQRHWLAAFETVGARVFVWTPGGWFTGRIQRVLAGE